MIFEAKLWAKLFGKAIISLCLAGGMFACQPKASDMHADESEASSFEGEKSSDGFAKASSKRRPDFKVSFATSDRDNDWSPLSLVSSISYVEFSVLQCASGFSISGLGAATQSFQLYRYDQGCKVTLDRFTSNGEIFVLTAGHTFNSSVNAENSFTGNLGTIVQVKVMKQLPLILDSADADVNFLVTEHALGSNISVLVYQVGISVSPPTVTEGDINPATFSVRRATPAVGSLLVNLESSGTAVPGVDISSVPTTIVLADGQSEVNFTVSALSDAVLDDNKTLIMNIGMGAYQADNALATLTIRDKPPLMPPTWNSIVGSLTVSEGTAVNFAVTANNPNSDETLSYAINSLLSTCLTGWSPGLSISSNGVIYGFPTNAAVGSCLLVITASNSVATISQDINFTVQNIPEPPVWTQTFSTSSLFDGEALALSFLAQDPDLAGVVSYALDASSTCQGASWTTAPSISATTGLLTGTPSGNSVGNCTIVIRASSQGDLISFTLNVTVSKRTLLWSAPAGVVANSCIPLTVLLGDGMGRLINAPSGATLNMKVNNGSGTFHSSNSCGTAITTMAWPAGVDRVLFYFRSTTSGQNLTLVATAGTYEPGVQSLNVGTAATRLVVSGPSSLAVSQCVKYRIDQADAAGNKVAVSAAKTINVTWPGTISAFTNASCDNSLYSTTIPAWDTGFDVYLYGFSTGSGFLRATDPAAILTANQLNVTVTASRPWWNSLWGSRSRIQVENLDQAAVFTNQPVLVRLTPQRLDYSKVKSNGADLRFVASDNATVLPHQIQQWVPYGTSLVWVKVDTIAASSSQSFFYMYFNNADASVLNSAAQVWTDYNGIYHLTESPSAAAPQYKDSTSAANHGTAVAGPGSSLGPIGAVASFLGVRDHISMNSNLSTVLGGTATFSAWMKTTQVGTTPGWNAPAITGIETVGNGNDIQYGWLDNTGRLGITAGNGANAQSNFIVNDNAWRYITVTRQASNGLVQFFVNGVQNGSGTSETGVKTGAFRQIGMLWDSGNAHRDFNGLIGEVRIFNGVMTASRIRADYKYQLDSSLTYCEAEAY